VLPVPLAIRVLDPMLSALASAHRAGLGTGRESLRRADRAGGVVKVADFGLVRAIATASTTSNDKILGTVAICHPNRWPPVRPTRAVTSTRPASLLRNAYRSAALHRRHPHLVPTGT